MKLAKTRAGRWLRGWRVAHELTQADVARIIGCSPALLSDMESGKIRWRRIYLARMSLKLSKSEAESFADTILLDCEDANNASLALGRIKLTELLAPLRELSDAKV